MTVEQITGEQVLAAVKAAGITRVDHHECSLCGSMVFYSVDGDDLLFHPACGCSWSPPEPREWSSVADWINMQTEPKWRDRLMKRFGLMLENADA